MPELLVPLYEAAFARFDSELRQTDEWSAWTENLAYRHAVRHRGRLYPAKAIQSLASGVPRDELRGGDRDTNAKLRAAGLDVVTLKRTWLCGSQGAGAQYQSHEGYEDRLGQIYPWDSNVPNSKQIHEDDLILIWRQNHIVGASTIDRIDVHENVTKTSRRCPACVEAGHRSTVKRLSTGLLKCDVPGHPAFSTPVEHAKLVTGYRAHYAEHFRALSTPLTSAQIRSAAIRYNERQSIRLMDPRRLVEEVGLTDDGRLTAALAYLGGLESVERAPSPDRPNRETRPPRSRVGEPGTTSDEKLQRIIAALGDLESLDLKSGAARKRAERNLLEEWLFGTAATATCGFCGRMLPRRLLIGAHIKQRAECSSDERLDVENIVMRACALGCDILYERGYITVQDGMIARGLPPETEDVEAAVAALVGERCTAWHERSARYFAWHAERVRTRRELNPEVE